MAYSRKQSAPWAKDPASGRPPSRPLPRARFNGQAEYSPPPPSLIAQFAGTVGNLLVGSLLLGSTATAAGLMGLAISFRNLPDVHQLRDYVPIATTHIVDIRGEPIASIHGEANREVISVEEVSPEMKKALLAIEDSHFYTHQGINPISLGRVILGSVEGGIGSAGGGSTLTMQLVKNLFLSPERTLSRKVAEVVLAVRMEQIFSKDEILEMYLNQVYWGHNLYGIEAAARSYFNKSAAELNLAESAMLAGILPAPETLSPFRNMEGARRRQRLVLDRLLELGWVSPEEAQAAREQELTLGRITSFQSNAPAVTDAIEAEIRRRYGEQALMQGGLRVQSTIDLRLQRIAQRIVNEDGPRVGGARRADQMALAAVDPRTGYVKAVVGGINAQRGQFNRATQAFRQTGSTFKPYVFYAALATGRYSPGSILEDTPITYPGSLPYSPKNYDNTFYGPLSFARALELSRNVPTVKLADDVGIRNVIAAAQATGISAQMFPNLATALGSASISPLEMAASYAVFANGGHALEPTLLAQVVDRNGQILFEAKPSLEQVLDPWSVAVLNQILKGVVTGGTGTAARLDDGRPVAGKTGTTSDFRDAWFIGYVPQLSTAIWIGNDDNSPMLAGTAGGAFVAPTWKRFMTEALEGIPAQDFPSPNQFARPR